MRYLILFLALLAAGCASPGYRNGVAPAAMFDLGVPASTQKQGVRPWRFSLVSTNGGEGSSMLYRLAYADGSRVMEYANSRWISTPSDVLRKRLEGQLFWESVHGTDNCRLQLEVRRFEQVFSSANQSAGVLAVRASLMAQRGGLVDERLWVLEAPAPTPDAPGGVKALASAADQLALALKTWRTQMSGQQSDNPCGD